MTARSAAASYRIGIDIGGTKTLAIAVGPRGELLGEVLLPSGFGPAGVLDPVVEAVRQLREALPGRGLLGVGVGIPGTVDHVSGEVRQALNLGLEHFPLGTALAELLGVPVHVENDVNAAALGATARDAPGAGRSLAFLNLGTGLAVGLVLDGRLWRGASGAAGEIGHIPVDPGGAVCVCGQRGCLEPAASGSGIARQWGNGTPKLAEIQTLADGGDPRAVATMTRLIAAVAAAVRLIVLTNDVERVVIGGGIAEALGFRLLDPVRELLRGWEAGSPFLASLHPSARIALVPEGAPVAALGAALAASQPLGSAAASQDGWIAGAPEPEREREQANG